MDYVWLAVLVVLILFIAYGWVLWSLHGQMMRRQTALVACETRARKDLARRAAGYFVKRATNGSAGLSS